MNMFDKFFNEIERMKNMEISVGVFGEEAAEVAFYNEDGSLHKRVEDVLSVQRLQNIKEILLSAMQAISKELMMQRQLLL